MTAPRAHDELLGKGWARGRVLPEALVSHIRWNDGAATPPEGVRAVIVAQDCDVLHDSFDAEPTVDIVGGAVVEDRDSTYRNAKNSRRLDIALSSAGGSGGDESVRLEMRWRGTVPRRLLLVHNPSDFSVAKSDMKTLIAWTTRRYERPVFPDAFDKRLKAKKGRKALQKILAKAKDDQPLVIYVAMMPDQIDVELLDNQSYKVDVIVVLHGNLTPDDDEWQEFEETVYDPLIKHLKQVEGIEVLTHELRPESQVSLREIRLYLNKLDFDDLSLQDDAEETMPIVP